MIGSKNMNDVLLCFTLQDHNIFDNQYRRYKKERGIDTGLLLHIAAKMPKIPDTVKSQPYDDGESGLW